jgi:hypothetical protein
MWYIDGVDLDNFWEGLKSIHVPCHHNTESRKTDLDAALFLTGFRTAWFFGYFMLLALLHQPFAERLRRFRFRSVARRSSCQIDPPQRARRNSSARGPTTHRPDKGNNCSQIDRRIVFVEGHVLW